MTGIIRCGVHGALARGDAVRGRRGRDEGEEGMGRNKSLAAAIAHVRGQNIGGDTMLVFG